MLRLEYFNRQLNRTGYFSYIPSSHIWRCDIKSQNNAHWQRMWASERLWASSWKRSEPMDISGVFYGICLLVKRSATGIKPLLHYDLQESDGLVVHMNQLPPNSESTFKAPSESWVFSCNSTNNQSISIQVVRSFLSLLGLWQMSSSGNLSIKFELFVSSGEHALLARASQWSRVKASSGHVCTVLVPR